MVLYNVTIKVEHGVAKEWLHWMQKEHIPAVMATGCFIGQQMFRLLTEPDAEGITFAVQYQVVDAQTLEKYRTHFAPALIAETEKKFGGTFVSFRSVLESI